MRNSVSGLSLRPQVEAVRSQRCENCAFLADAVMLGMKAKVCKQRGPTPMLVPVGVDSQGKPHMNVVATWPPVPPNEWCYAWKAKVLGVKQGAGDGG